MPPVMIRSAQAKSFSVTSDTFLSISRQVQSAGSRAATVIRPSGIAEWRAFWTLQTALLFQNVFAGNWGYTNRTLQELSMDCLFPMLGFLEAECGTIRADLAY